MRRATPLCIAIAVAAMLFGVAGCGSSDDSASAIETSNLTKAQWIKRASDLCAKSAEPLVGRVSQYEEKNAAESQRGYERVAGEAIYKEVPPILSELTDQLRALGAPEEYEEQVEALLLAFDEDIKSLEQDGPSLTGLTELEDTFHSSGKLAARYGLDNCAYG